jgi:carbonic anhydrase
MDTKDTIEKLVMGNNRFVNGNIDEKDYESLREETAQVQHPFAIIVGCSDSRVSPEIIFDQSIGDLFVIRTAGHVVDEIALGSIQYGVLHLHCELIVVLGHERCGAVTAAVDGAEEEGGIAAIVKAIEPAVERTKGMRVGDPITNAVKANALMVAEQLKLDPMLNTTRIIAAYYDLDSGRVHII